MKRETIRFEPVYKKSGNPFPTKSLGYWTLGYWYILYTSTGTDSSFFFSFCLWLLS